MASLPTIRRSLIATFLMLFWVANTEFSAGPPVFAAGQDQPAGRQVLRVGVKEPPKYMSPALACTYPELQALDLLFDSLLTISYDEKIGQRYHPVLARSLPSLLPDGRRFVIHANTLWPDGQTITAADIRTAIELLRNSKGTPESFLWNEVLKAPKIGTNPLQIDFEYRQTFYDPLRPFTFKLLPQSYGGKPLVSVMDPDFAMSPVGSGPYQLQQAKGQVRLVINPKYAEAHNLPPFAIDEIQFHAVQDPFREFTDANSPLHILPDVSDELAAYLKWQDAAQIETAETNRIYFIAINHRITLLQNRDLRQALAAALDREEFLEECFRRNDPSYQALGIAGAALNSASAFLQKVPTRIHHKLNGPFPANSWAVAPTARVPAKLHDAERARLLLEKVQNEVKDVSLSFKYPNNDPRIEIACRRMVQQWQSAAGKAGISLQIKLVPMGEHELWQAVKNRDYELAYFHWDYASEYYWLWPLFDPSADALAAGGSNFLGYKNDATLVSMMRVRMSHRDFRRVREISHDIHAHLHDRMPLIPLWQLDMHTAVHPDLETGPFEPLRIFQNVGQWKLRK